MSPWANCVLQGRHHACLRTELAPRFQARDILLVRNQIHECPAGLIAVPAAHPCREVTRHRRRHCQILAACERAHIDGDLRSCRRRKKRDCKCRTHRSKLHFARPFSQIAYEACHGRPARTPPARTIARDPKDPSRKAGNDDPVRRAISSLRDREHRLMVPRPRLVRNWIDVSASTPLDSRRITMIPYVLPGCALCPIQAKRSPASAGVPASRP